MLSVPVAAVSAGTTSVICSSNEID